MDPFRRCNRRAGPLYEVGGKSSGRRRGGSGRAGVRGARAGVECRVAAVAAPGGPGGRRRSARPGEDPGCPFGQRRPGGRRGGWSLPGNLRSDGGLGAALGGNQRDDLAGRDVGGWPEAGQMGWAAVAAGLQAGVHQFPGRLDVVVIGPGTGTAMRVGGMPAQGAPHRQRYGGGETTAVVPDRSVPVQNQSTRVGHVQEPHFLIGACPSVCSVRAGRSIPAVFDLQVRLCSSKGLLCPARSRSSSPLHGRS